jgi:hypothetical protein
VNTDGTRAYRATRRVAVRALAFALRHGLDDSEALEAIRRAFPHRAADVSWRLALVDEADRRNTERYWRKLGRPWRHR